VILGLLGQIVDKLNQMAFIPFLFAAVLLGGSAMFGLCAIWPKDKISLGLFNRGEKKTTPNNKENPSRIVLKDKKGDEEQEPPSLISWTEIDENSKDYHKRRARVDCQRILDEAIRNASRLAEAIKVRHFKYLIYSIIFLMSAIPLLVAMLVLEAFPH
jgi:hypothetical protein